MLNDHKLERLISEGSSAVLFNPDPSVPGNEIWTKEKGLEKAINAENQDAVTIVKIKKGEKNKESYFFHGVYELISFSKEVEEENYKKAYDSMMPGVAYINAPSVEDFVGIVNLDYLIGLKKGKISDYFVNGSYLARKPGKNNDKSAKSIAPHLKIEEKYIKPTLPYPVIKNVGQGAGLIASKITDRIADWYNFPRPKPGDIVVGIGYFKDSVTEYEKTAPYAFPMVVSALRDKMQVPSEVINSLYFEVILGADKKLGKSLV